MGNYISSPGHVKVVLGPEKGGEIATSPINDLERHGMHDNGLTDQTFYLPRRKIITVRPALKSLTHPLTSALQIFLACASTEVVALLDEKGVAAALSIISSELHAGSKISWVASAYFLYVSVRCFGFGAYGLVGRTSTACTPLYGRISDIYSRKNVLFTLMAVFFFGSFAASLAQSVVQLIVFRAITGIGGGGLILLGQLIIGDVVTVRERGKYQGILVSTPSPSPQKQTETGAKGRVCSIVERDRAAHRSGVFAKCDLVSLWCGLNAYMPHGCVFSGAGYSG
jgi:hypothetical protein